MVSEQVNQYVTPTSSRQKKKLKRQTKGNNGLTGTNELPKEMINKEMSVWNSRLLYGKT